jgi:hypothetical protein
MSIRFALLPDLEAATSVALRAANIPGLQGVHSSIPAKNPAYPLLIIQRLGGTPAVREYLDRARIQIDVWGGARKEGERSIPKSTILDIAQLARVALLELEGQIVDPSGLRVFVSAVEDALGITWSPDPTSGRDRYVFSMWVYGREVT